MLPFGRSSLPSAANEMPLEPGCLPADSLFCILSRPRCCKGRQRQKKGLGSEWVDGGLPHLPHCV